MAYELDDKLVVAISSMALFDLAEADAVFREQGSAAYRVFQRAKEDEPLQPGSAFGLIRALLHLNELSGAPLVEVILISKNDADTGFRVMSSIKHYDLPITRAAFTAGRSRSEYLKAFSCDLFLSKSEVDVAEALLAGFPAALVFQSVSSEAEGEEVRIAFDGDAVIFSGESEAIFKSSGLEAFLRNETSEENIPMKPGPLLGFVRSLVKIQSHFPEHSSPIRLSLVTARNAPAHARVVRTLRHWGLRFDECFFLGGVEKRRVLEVLKPHIFFDDQELHLRPAAEVVACAQVPQH